MPDLDPALLKAILANSADYQVRRVAADWLEEHGDLDRATYLRNSVVMAVVGPKRAKHDRKRYDACQKRMKALLEKHKEDWKMVTVYHSLGETDKIKVAVGELLPLG